VFSKCSSVMKLAAKDVAPSTLGPRSLQGHVEDRIQGETVFQIWESRPPRA
jgi:hypothetical protein